jgi:hypothetical protein
VWWWWWWLCAVVTVVLLMVAVAVMMLPLSSFLAHVLAHVMSRHCLQISEMYADTELHAPSFHAYLWMPVIGAGSTLQFQALTQMLSFFPTVSVQRIPLLELRTALPFRFQLTTRQLESVHRHWDTTATTTTITTPHPATPLHTLLMNGHLMATATPTASSNI